MKTLAGWIVGIFALGLAVGSFFGGAADDRPAAEPETLESVLASAPAVDCGSGREAVLQPIVVDGRTTVQVKCIASAPVRIATAVPVAPASTQPATVREVAAAPASPASEAPAQEVKKSRSAKETALIIGGSAGAGAGIGAVTKGKKGAAVGAVIGGVAGTVYDLMTRNRK